jgi:ABC-2 type transport system ATP-binding protein
MIRAVQLQKRFGRFEALRGVSLQAAQGEVVGLVGPNGAGKTTTLRILAGLLKPSGDLTGMAFIEFIHGLYGVDNMKEAVELSGLGPRVDDKIKTYSKGMRRRLVVAALLTVGARVLLLDEPTSGVDVLHAVEIRRAVKEYARSRGAAVMYSSHNMLEVQTVCDRVYFIDRGVIVDSGTPAELLQRYGAADLEEAFVKALQRRA